MINLSLYTNHTEVNNLSAMLGSGRGKVLYDKSFSFLKSLPFLWLPYILRTLDGRFGQMAGLRVGYILVFCL